MRQLTILAILASFTGVLLIFTISQIVHTAIIEPSKLAAEVRQPILVTGTVRSTTYTSGWVEGTIEGTCSFPFSYYAGQKQRSVTKISSATHFKGELKDDQNGRLLYLESYW